MASTQQQPQQQQELNNSSNTGKTSKRKSRSKRRSQFPRVGEFREIETKNLHESPTLTQSDLLEKTLRDLNLVDSEEGLKHREHVIQCLQSILDDWLSSLQSPAKWQRSTITLVPFGSYSLGAHKPDADLDILAIAPSNVSREEFFDSLVQRLRDDERAQQVHPVPAAYTPVVKFNFSGINIDLLFCSLKNNDSKLRRYQGSPYPIDDSDLCGLDEPSVRSLNGARVAGMILDYVPNKENFRTVLRAVKEWANVHGLYSNVLGFLGGINFAILVAAICRKHRDATVPTLMKAFFFTFSRWKWPKPVTLLPIAPNPPEGVEPMHVWNANDSRDRHHLLPIITPSYPSMNSAYNVGVPQRRRLKWEFEHAYRIIQRIEQRRAQWSDLFKGNDFFRRNGAFLQVTISSPNEEYHREWFRFVESRLRLLIVALDTPDVVVEPFAKFFNWNQNNNDESDSDAHKKNNRHVTCFFMALRFRQRLENIDLGPNMSEFLHIINTWGNRKQGMDVSIEYVNEENLKSYGLFKEAASASKTAGDTTITTTNGNGQQLNDNAQQSGKEDNYSVSDQGSNRNPGEQGKGTKDDMTDEGTAVTSFSNSDDDDDDEDTIQTNLDYEEKCIEIDTASPKAKAQPKSMEVTAKENPSITKRQQQQPKQQGSSWADITKRNRPFAPNNSTRSSRCVMA